MARPLRPTSRAATACRRLRPRRAIAAAGLAAALLATVAPAAITAGPAGAATAAVTAIEPTPTGAGYRIVGVDGSLAAFGDATSEGSLAGTPLARPVVDAATTPSGDGYWLVADDGGIFAFGDATFLGSTGNIRLNRPIVGLAATPSGNGYWLVADDGGIFAFGDATFLGSTGNIRLNRPIVGLAATPSGNGYWLVASDGGIFSFGDARFLGSTGDNRLNRPIVGMDATASGNGYRLVADGGIFAFGDATFLGSTGALVLNRPIVGLATTPSGGGYWLVADDGGIFAFGDATFLGSTVVPPLSVQLTRIASLSAPVDLAVRPGDPTLYVVEKAGVVRSVRDGVVDPTPVLDLRGQVSTGGEQGLLGLTFTPDGNRFDVNYTDVAGDTHVVEYAFGADGRAVVGSARELLFVDQPFPNHNGGQLAYGPDGMLYIALGDGGSANDPGNRAQSLGTLLGKILRIDPRPTASGDPYSVPPDNPFVTTDGARPEIWAFGLRNPWRFAFDPANGDLWIGDVGQNAREEIDFSPAPNAGRGLNYGWPRFEGTRLVSGGVAPADSQPPIHEYDNPAQGCSVTGGRVYWGTGVPALVGRYVFADFCAGRLQAITRSGGATEVTDLHVTAPQISSFGVDGRGELYVLSLAGGLFRIDPS